MYKITSNNNDLDEVFDNEYINNLIDKIKVIDIDLEYKNGMVDALEWSRNLLNLSYSDVKKIVNTRLKETGRAFPNISRYDSGQRKIYQLLRDFLIEE